MTIAPGTLLNLALCVLLLTLAYYYYRVRTGPKERIADRVRTIRSLKINTADDVDDPDDTLAQRILKRLADLGERLPILDAKQRSALTQTLIRAGFRGRRATALLVAAKFFSGLFIGIVAFSFAHRIPTYGQFFVMRIFALLVSFVVGMILPEYVLAYHSRRRRNEISLYLPDALDLLVICTNAGNSLAVSIRRVADELAVICPPLSGEFSLTADELKLSGDSTRALQGLAERIDLPSIRALISTLTQSMRYGTPITQALRTLSRTERLAHIVSLEEKAAKLAPKMVLPMMLFILPAVVAIAAGPAVIQLMEVIGK